MLFCKYFTHIFIPFKAVLIIYALKMHSFLTKHSMSELETVIYKIFNAHQKSY